MDPESCEEGYRKALAGALSEKNDMSESFLGDKIEERQDLGDCFVSLTPEKPDLGSRTREAVSLARKQLAEGFNEELSGHFADVHSGRREYDSVELPDKYKILVDLFNRMETAIRLLGLRKIPPTFQSISKQVEVLTKRKLLHSHIAQMKYVFSEAINIEKILVHDKENLLMIPEMKITVNKLVVEHIPESYRSASMALCDAFHARLLNFYSTHPEVTDIPRATLPDPFNKIHNTDEILNLEVGPKERSNELPPQISVESDFLSTASHLPLSFGKRFSNKEQRSVMLFSKACIDSSKIDVHALEVRSPQKLEVSYSSAETPAKVIPMPKETAILKMFESTPSKGASNLGVVMTPVMQTPKRPLPTPQEKLVLVDEESDVESKVTTSARRSLMYTPTSGSDQVDSSSCSNRVLGYSQDKIVFAKRCLLKEAAENSLPDAVDNILANQIQQPNLNQNRDTMNNEIRPCLATFDAICLISRAANCLEITKEELVHKILSNNLEIEETSEVEEQLNELELLIPEWISKRDASNGKVIYCINQMYNPEAFRARLVDAV